MTPLAHLIAARIAATGPITLADYMRDCLTHPDHGYYSSRDPLGVQGDFVTAPEISQMFGELLGVCLAQSWLDQGAPSQITLAELGPGRGTLMADALRATAGVPGFHAALSLHLVETPGPLRSAQARLLPTAQWHDSVATLPEAPLYLIANEFFDALPIRQFIRSGDGWSEVVVGLSDGHLTLGQTTPAPLGALQHRLSDTRDGTLVELCPALPGITGHIGGLIARHGGAALITDYGDWRSQGDTWQALRGHAPTDPLAEPGLADLTAHVDFEALASAASPAKHTRLTRQGVFLERLGIAARAQKLADSLSGPARAAHLAAHRRLTHPAEMGQLFKVIGLYPASATPPPGLEP